MRTIETMATVSPDGTLTARVPPDVPPGEHRVVLVIQEQLAERVLPSSRAPLRLHTWQWKAWPADSTFRREDLYEDDEP
jgi:hypothetical protein